ncbi:MAG: serine/threonine protein phosphatase [Clostridia bacterium]|nr:serine/threonine protein phosphatase [Clostridia bacterium]
MRTIIIGDIHGCNDSLQSLLANVSPIPGKDRLVLLGDLFDRGPDSLQVFQTIQKLAEEFGNDFVLLRGNHEDYLLQPKLTLWQRMIWEKVGRSATVRSFMQAGQKMEDTIPWLREHCAFFWKSNSFQCVHAGVMVEPLEANDLQTLIHDHEIVPENRYNGILTITGHIALNKATWFAGDGETVMELEDDMQYELPEKGVICIDTGCGKGGPLTAMISENQCFTLLSVPS